MASQPEVTVIIPNYNGKKLLENCIQTLERQTCTDFKLLVVDNGSDDGSTEVTSSPVSYTHLDVYKRQFLSRLVKKGFLNMYRKGRYCYYQPLVSKEDFWRATMEESAKFFTKGDLGELACCLCDDMLDAKDIEKLKKKLNEHS